MKTYWDTSGLINAAISGTVLQRLTSGEHTTRTHTLAEFYGILTGRGIRWERDGQAYELRLTGGQAAQWLKDNLTSFQFIDLSAQEVLSTMAQSQQHNVAGARVHDYLHAVAAQEGQGGRTADPQSERFQRDDLIHWHPHPASAGRAGGRGRFPPRWRLHGAAQAGDRAVSQVVGTSGL